MDSISDSDATEVIESAAEPSRISRQGLNVLNITFCMECKGNENPYMVCCNNCKFWIHYSCANLDQNLVDQIKEFYCKECVTVSGLSTSWKQESRHVTRTEKRKWYFPVKKIIRHKIANNERFFLIHWESYGIAERNWEPEKNLDGAINILQKYLETKKLPYSRVIVLDKQ